MVMQNALGAEYEVLGEGLNGRTTVWEDPIEEHKCGKTHLIPIIKTHQPFDLLIMMLGTNDLKKRVSDEMGCPSLDIDRGCEFLEPFHP